MTTKRVMMLEGPEVITFFLKETLLDEGLADRVDLVSAADQAIDQVRDGGCYDLVIVNMVEAWEQGTQLVSWLSQQCTSFPVMLIVPSESVQPFPAALTSVTLLAPFSLRDFIKSVYGTMYH